MHEPNAWSNGVGLLLAAVLAGCGGANHSFATRGGKAEDTRRAERDAAFDRHVRTFPLAGVFATPSPARYLIAMDVAPKTGLGYLSNNFFAADTDLVAYQQAHRGFDGNLLTEWMAGFEGGLVAHYPGGDSLLIEQGGRKGILHRLDDEAAERVLQQVRFAQLPATEIPIYLGRLANGSYLLVTCPKYPLESYNWPHRAFWGTAGSMRELQVTDVKTNHGGATITTTAGTIVADPAPGRLFFQGMELIWRSVKQDADLIARLGVDMGEPDEQPMVDFLSGPGW